MATVVVDIASGGVVASFENDRGRISPDGTVLTTNRFRDGQARLLRLSLPSGAVLTDAPNPGWDLVVNQQSGLVLSYESYNVHLLDGETLHVLWSGTLNQAGWGGADDPVFDPSSSLLYTIGSSGEFDVFDTAARELRAQARLRAHGSPSLALTTGPVPDAPHGLNASVNGSDVALQWTAPLPVARAVRFVVEAGSGPGLSDILQGLDVGSSTNFSADSVPPGTYYVRVRAANYTGLGAASNEIVVQVP